MARFRRTGSTARVPANDAAKTTTKKAASVIQLMAGVYDKPYPRTKNRSRKLVLLLNLILDIYKGGCCCSTVKYEDYKIYIISPLKVMFIKAIV